MAEHVALLQSCDLKWPPLLQYSISSAEMLLIIRPLTTLDPDNLICYAQAQVRLVLHLRQLQLLSTSLPALDPLVVDLTPMLLPGSTTKCSLNRGREPQRPPRGRPRKHPIQTNSSNHLNEHHSKSLSSSSAFSAFAPQSAPSMSIDSPRVGFNPNPLSSRFVSPLHPYSHCVDETSIGDTCDSDVHMDVGPPHTVDDPSLLALPPQARGEVPIPPRDRLSPELCIRLLKMPSFNTCKTNSRPRKLNLTESRLQRSSSPLDRRFTSMEVETRAIASQ